MLALIDKIFIKKKKTLEFEPYLYLKLIGE